MRNIEDNFSFEKLRSIPDLERAYVIVTKLFDGKTDFDGDKYINHLRTVSERLYEIDEKIVAVLHDIVNQTDVTFEELEKAGFSKEVVDAVRLLTRDKDNEEYGEFIDRLVSSDNLLALKVKYVDMGLNREKLETAILDIYEKIKLEDKYNGQYERIVDRKGELEHDRYKTNKGR